MSKHKADFPIAVHPGEILQEMLDENNLAQAALARRLGMDPSRINEICRGKGGISAVTAVKLAKAFGQSVEIWLNLQKNWELSRVDPQKVKDIEPILA